MLIRPPTGSTPGSHWSIFLGAAGLLALFVVLSSWLSHEVPRDRDPIEAARSEERLKALATLRAQDAQKLKTFAWVDRANGSVQIPIELAMDRVLPELQSAKPKPAYPVASPRPSPPAAAIVPKP